jgi:hypothetical protein
MTSYGLRGKGKAVPVLNYIIKHYGMKACGGVDA